MLSIIIVSYNTRDLIIKCLGSIYENSAGMKYEVIVVDNNSQDGSLEAVECIYPQVKSVANKQNVGFARANNQGYAVSRGEYLLLLNPDTVVKPGAIEKVLEFMRMTPDAGLAACRLVNPDGSLQKSIKAFPTVMSNILQAVCLDKIFFRSERSDTYYREKPFSIDYPAGAFMMIRREALAGQPYLLNPDFHMYAEEKDLALRLKENGWRCYFVPDAEIIHYGGQSTGQMPVAMFLELQRSQAKFYYRHNRGLKANILCLSWRLVLISSFIRSLLSFVISRNNLKVKMMWEAFKKYPEYCRQAKNEYRR